MKESNVLRLLLLMAFSCNTGAVMEEQMLSATRADLAEPRICCRVIELRQYTLRPGKRDVLIDLFDREFVESQEETGMRVLGQFRDLDHPDRFVWLRGFDSMTERKEALQAFYGGPVWKAHREAANATMIDSSNVLLLRPARVESGFKLKGNRRSGKDVSEARKERVVATIYYLKEPADQKFIDFFERTMTPVVIKAGGTITAFLLSENSPNTFPALPVREGESVFVWLSRFSDQAAYDQYRAFLGQSTQWKGEIAEALQRLFKKPPEVLNLSPTSRSLLY